MIASLRGTIVSLNQSATVIDVAGVGYLTHITTTTSAQLKLGSDAQLFTTLVVREDALTLYGFLNQNELSAFELLRSVTGVGPKSALAILSALSIDDIGSAVASENDAVFKSVSGIGPKTAKLIVVTLAGKLSSSGKTAIQTTHNAGVVSALVGLGWAERLAVDAVTAAAKQFNSLPTENELLKASLATLGTSKSVSASDE